MRLFLKGEPTFQCLVHLCSICACMYHQHWLVESFVAIDTNWILIQCSGRFIASNFNPIKIPISIENVIQIFALRKNISSLQLWKCGSTVWKHPHCEALIKGTLIARLWLKEPPVRVFDWMHAHCEALIKGTLIARLWLKAFYLLQFLYHICQVMEPSVIYIATKLWFLKMWFKLLYNIKWDPDF